MSCYKLVIAFALSISQTTSFVAGYEKVCIPGIGSRAPAFKADTNKGLVSFPEDYEGVWTILFSHPADFTPVCETEFKELAKMVKEFESINAYLLGLSVDSKYVHDVWVKELQKEVGAEGKLNFPIVADLSKRISKKYGMIHPDESKKQTVRAVYIIDPSSTIRATFFYPISNGRSFKEVMRLLTALQITDEKGVATPAEWQPGMLTIPKENWKMAGFA